MTPQQQDNKAGPVAAAEPEARRRLPEWLRRAVRPAAVWLSHVVEAARWYDNPFLVKELHAAARKPLPLRGMAIVLGVLATVFIVAALIGRQHAMSGISLAWGGALGALVLMPLSLAHYAFVSATVSVRSGDWITTEANQGTLGLLLVTPISPAQIVLKRAMAPFLAGLVVIVIPLPLYVLCITMGGVAAGTVVALHLLFILLAFTESGPRPPRVTGQRERPGGSSVNVKQGIRAWQRNTGWSWMVTLMWLLLIFGTMRGGFSVNPLGIFAAAGKGLAAPHGFFGAQLHPVIPLLLLTPLGTAVVVMSWAQRLVVHGATSTPALARCRTLLIVSVLFVGLGYAWPYLLTSGIAGRLVPGAASPACDLQGILLVLLTITALVTGLESVVSRPPSLGLLTLFGWRPEPGTALGKAAALGCVNALSALAAPILVFVAACALAGTSPLVVGLPFAGKALAVSAATILFSFGLGTLLAAMLMRSKGAWCYVFGLFIYGLLLCAPFSASYAFESVAAQRALSSLSPWGGMMDLAKLPDILVPAPWLEAVAVQLAVGVVLWLTGVWIWMARVKGAADVRILQPVAEPTQSAPGPSLVETWGKRCLRIQRLWDNPILVRGVRYGYRKDQWGVVLALFGVAFVGFCVVLLLWPDAVIDFAILIPFQGHIADLRGARFCAGAAAVTPIVFTGLGVMALLVPAIAGGNLIARERRDGTLAFTLMTPLSPAEISLGTAAAAVYPIALLLALAVVPCLLSALASWSVRSILVFATCVIWVVMLAVTGSGLAIGLSALWRFRSKGSQASVLLAVLWLLIMEALRMGLAAAMARWYGTGLWLHAMNWGLMGAEALLGVLGYLIAYRVLGQMQYAEIPTEGEAAPATP